MRLKDFVPLPCRKAVRTFLQLLRGSAQASPLDVVKANTKEAFEFFFSQDAFITNHYLEPSRLAFYEAIGDYCVQLLGQADNEEVLRIIDIGCGTGNMLATLRRRFGSIRRLELFGLDFASTAIEKAKTLLPEGKFVIADLYEHDTFPADSFDLVLCIETLEHLLWPERAILQLLRVCKPQGRIIITVPNAERDSWDGHVNFWNLSKFEEFLSPYGLIDIAVIEDESSLRALLVKQTHRRLQHEGPY